MKEIMSKGEQVLESDFPSKCKKVSKVADAKEDLRLMLVVSADLKHRLSEFKRVIVSEESIEAITENICKKESSPSNALCDGEAIIESDKVDAIPQDVSQVPTIEDTSSKAISKVEDIVSELEGSDDEDDDPDCIELTTIGGEILYYEASGNKIYRLDEDCEGVCIGIMEEVLDSNKRACTLNGKDYAIGEELKSGKDVLFRCVITNNVYKRQSKGLKYFGVCRQGADGTCTITKKK